MSSFCVKCKKATNDVGPRMTMSKNGRSMMRSKCANCGCGKCKFVAAGNTKGRKGGNLLTSLAGLLL